MKLLLSKKSKLTSKRQYFNQKTKKIFVLKINEEKTSTYIKKTKGNYGLFKEISDLLEMQEQTGYWISNCLGISTFFLEFSIDVVFLDKNKIVVELYNDLKPNKITQEVKSAFYCLVLPAFQISNLNIKERDYINYEVDWDRTIKNYKKIT